MVPILDDSPIPFPVVVNKPDYMTERRKYLAWKKDNANQARYEDAFNTLMGFLWVNGKGHDMVWRDGWLRDR